MQVGMCGQELYGLCPHRVGLPGLGRCAHDVQVGILGNGLVEAFGSVHSRRGSWQTVHLDNVGGLALALQGNIFTHHVAYAFVVAADVSSVVIRFHFPVDQYDGYAGILGTSQHMLVTVIVVRREDDGINMGVDERVYLPFLQVMALVGIGNFKPYAWILHASYFDFFVQLVRPVACASHGKADCLFAIVAAAGEQHRDKQDGD